MPENHYAQFILPIDFDLINGELPEDVASQIQYFTVVIPQNEFSEILESWPPDTMPPKTISHKFPVRNEAGDH
jgi:hypothetical protein